MILNIRKYVFIDQVYQLLPFIPQIKHNSAAWHSCFCFLASYMSFIYVCLLSCLSVALLVSEKGHPIDIMNGFSQCASYLAPASCIHFLILWGVLSSLHKLHISDSVRLC